MNEQEVQPKTYEAPKILKVGKLAEMTKQNYMAAGSDSASYFGLVGFGS